MLFLFGLVGIAHAGKNTLRIITSGTASETGIIEAVAEEFRKVHPQADISFSSAPSLKVLDGGREGKADLLITHHPQGEALFAEEGYSHRHVLFMYNEFVLMGPRADPLDLHGERDLMVVMRRLAKAKAPFISPNVRSGTTSRLNNLWALAGITPDWPGYEINDITSAAAFKKAAELGVYSLVDFGTYLQNRSKISADYVPLYRDNVLLRNAYSAIVVNPDKVPGANHELADAFLEYLVSPAGQTFIRQFGEKHFGTILFSPAAHLDEGLKARKSQEQVAEQKHRVVLLSTLAGVLAAMVAVAFWLYRRVNGLERLRQQNEERFALAVAGSRDGLWDWDVEKANGFFSPRACEILGLPFVEERTGRYCDVISQCADPADREDLDDILRAYVFEAPEPDFVETRFRMHAADGAPRWVLLRGKASRNADGVATRLSGSLSDITASVASEEVNRAALAEKVSAQAANRAKSEFLANMSHEIRTPLTAIIGFTDTLLDAEQPASERVAAVNTIANSGRHLLQIINNILDLSKIESDKLEVENIAVAPVELVEEVRALVEGQAKAQGLELRVEYAPPLPAQILSDPTRLRQILLNLCGNAIKFTPRGSVHLRVSCDCARDSLRIEVRDTGVGLKPDELSKLFGAFAQADSSTTRRYGGSGLGLHLSRRLAQLLGGDISVTSEPGVGSCFTLHVATGPLADVSMLSEIGVLAERRAAPASRKLPALCGRVLLAEDNPDNQQLLSRYIEQIGGEVVIAENGQRAVELAQSRSFDVVLMDMQMPVMDGLEATRFLRHGGYRGPIVALTANAFKEDRDACLAAGCDDFMTKPILRNALHALLARHLESAESAAPNTAPIRSAMLDTEPDLIDLIVKFSQRLPEQVQHLVEACGQEDWDALKRTAHDIKGMGGGYGFPQVTDVAAKLEFEILKHDIDAVRQRLEELHDLAKRVALGVKSSEPEGQSRRAGMA